MGFLTEIEHRLEGRPEAFSLLRFSLSRKDGGLWDTLGLDERDEVYQVLVDAIRAKATEVVRGGTASVDRCQWCGELLHDGIQGQCPECGGPL